MALTVRSAPVSASRTIDKHMATAARSASRIASGLRVTSAADDAAGLVIGERLKAVVGGVTVAARNAQDGCGVLQTADSGLQEMTSLLQRARDLAVRAAST